jgi:hypothetical protein
LTLQEFVESVYAPHMTWLRAVALWPSRPLTDHRQDVTEDAVQDAALEIVEAPEKIAEHAVVVALNRYGQTVPPHWWFDRVANARRRVRYNRHGTETSYGLEFAPWRFRDQRRPYGHTQLHNDGVYTVPRQPEPSSAGLDLDAPGLDLDALIGPRQAAEPAIRTTI